MTREEKTVAIESLKSRLNEVDYFYLTDSSTLTVDQVNKFRRLCFEKGVEMKVVKNTLMRKAMEAFPVDKNYEGLYDVLKGPTAVLFSEGAAALPAKLLKEFRKEHPKPVLKAAYIETAIYLGDDQIESLSQLKSKDDLLAEVVALLQSPAKNVISALQSGGKTIAGLVKTLSERSES